MSFPPELMVFHREEYQVELAQRRPKDYLLLTKKEVVGKVKFRHRRRNPYVKKEKALVSFVMASNDLKEDIRQAVGMIGGFGKALKPRDRILIKPNLNSDDPPPGSTALDFLQAVIEVLREHGCTDLTVGEGAGRVWVPTENVFRNLGVTAKMAEMKVPLLDFDQSRYIDVPLDGEFLDVIAYPKDLQEFDKIIYLPTMKAHYLAGFSMSLKLTVGLTHLADRILLHAENSQFVAQRSAEMNIPVKPDLIIMDGRISFISGGPAIGLAVHPGMILASGDQVAIDVQGVRLLQNYAAVNHLGMDAWSLPQIKTAVKHGLGIRKDSQLLLVR